MPTVRYFTCAALDVHDVDAPSQFFAVLLSSNDQQQRWSIIQFFQWIKTSTRIFQHYKDFCATVYAYLRLISSTRKIFVQSRTCALKFVAVAVYP